ncbi:protein FAR1-RELATED SEQUENCE 3-like [Cucumis melo var. makuwa]|uniref:Protein FAR1-RELATED SEQUENCE 3-like n=1 Tax=Cucumis melo var. makuwa TaxID=1194695 RepID=A0A5D3DQ78_CUCMM|nr:protein FAR1-RELATED SEQUENCE 3-like [Cucumis melo var. makuwa]
MILQCAIGNCKWSCASCCIYGDNGFLLGSVVEYKVDVDGRFLYFFMALSTSISGWQHCRSVISIDGTSLKNKYGGTLLFASTSDGNDQIFPLAFCVVDSENDSS